MIRAEEIHRQFDDFTISLSLAVADGELLTLLGASGSGKTTTLRILAGFEQPDRGAITVDGLDVTHVAAQHRRMGYVFQDYTLFPHLNVAENVAYGLRVQRVPAPERRRRVHELLELVGLAGFAGRAVQTLSGGEQQRVALARALAVEPRALLLDEPFSAVDTERREELRRYLVRVQRGLGIPTVFVTHSRSEALALSDRIIVLRDGRIEDQGSPERLYEHPHTEYCARFLGHANILTREQLAAVPGKAFSEDTEEAPDARETVSAEAGADLQAGATAFMIRPEYLTTAGADAGLPATVSYVAYSGAHRDYEFETPIGTLYLRSAERHDLGAHTTLRFPRHKLVPLPPKQ